MNNLEKTFLELTGIDSVSGHEDRLIKYIVPKLKSLNFTVEIDEHNNLYAKNFSGKVNDSILLSAHLDTVESTDGIEIIKSQNILHTNGQTILGADNKGALAEILTALQILEKSSTKNIEIIFSSGEELGLKGIKLFDFNKIQSKNAIVLDYSRPFGFIVSQAPSAYMIDLIINGKSSHASNVKNGTNAIELGAKFIATFSDTSGDSTYNFGLIKGGSAANVIPEKTTITIAVRSFLPNKFDEFVNQISTHFDNICCESDASCVIQSQKIGSCYKHSENNTFINSIIKLIEKSNNRVVYEKSFGLSDANALNEFGINAIEIGYGTINAHAKNEQIDLIEMQKTTQFLIDFLKA